MKLVPLDIRTRQEPHLENSEAGDKVRWLRIDDQTLGEEVEEMLPR